MDFKYELTVVPSPTWTTRRSSTPRSSASMSTSITELRQLVTFNDPDGNSWLVQEVTERSPGLG